MSDKSPTNPALDALSAAGLVTHFATFSPRDGESDPVSTEEEEQILDALSAVFPEPVLRLAAGNYAIGLPTSDFDLHMLEEALGQILSRLDISVSEIPRAPVSPDSRDEVVQMLRSLPNTISGDLSGKISAMIDPLRNLIETQAGTGLQPDLLDRLETFLDQPKAVPILEMMAQRLTAIDGRIKADEPSGGPDLHLLTEAMTKIATRLADLPARIDEGLAALGEEGVMLRPEAVPDDIRELPHTANRILEGVNVLHSSFDRLTPLEDANQRLSDLAERMDAIREAVADTLLPQIQKLPGLFETAVAKLDRAGSPDRSPALVEGRLADLSQRVEDLTELLTGIGAQTSRMHADGQTVARGLSGATIGLETIIRRLDTAVTQVEAIEGSRPAVEDRLVRLEERLERLGTQIDTVLERAVSPENGHADALDDRLSRIEAVLDGLPTRLARSADLTAEREGLTRTTAAFQAILSRFDREVSRLHDAEVVQAEAGADLSDIRALLADLTTRPVAVEPAEAQVAPLTNQLEALHSAIDALPIRITNTSNMTAEREGLARSTAALQGVIRRLDHEVSTLASHADAPAEILGRLDMVGAKLSAILDAPGTATPAGEELVNDLRMTLAEFVARVERSFGTAVAAE